MCKREKITVVEIWLQSMEEYKGVCEVLVERVPDLQPEDLKFKRHAESIRVN